MVDFNTQSSKVLLYFTKSHLPNAPAPKAFMTVKSLNLNSVWYIILLKCYLSIYKSGCEIIVSNGNCNNISLNLDNDSEGFLGIYFYNNNCTKFISLGFVLIYLTLK